MAGVPDMEGRVHIGVIAAAHKIRDVEIHSSRHIDACRVLVGKPVDQALAILPRLFSICGSAQAVAGSMAREALSGLQPTPQQSAARQISLSLETVQEHFGRLLIDWPRLYDGAGPDLPSLARVHTYLRATRDALGSIPSAHAKSAGGVKINAAALANAVEQLETLMSDVLLGMRSEEWLGIDDCAQLRGWYRSTHNVATMAFRRLEQNDIAEFGRCDMQLMPQIDAREFDQLLSGSSAWQIAARPYWRGKVYETGPLARQARWPLISDLRRRYGNGLIVRMAARFVELVCAIHDLPAQIAGLQVAAQQEAPRPSEQYIANGAGVGVVEAARGRLAHRLEVEQGVIRDYRILAPTEWNFHPEGPLVYGLRGLRFGELAELRQRIGMLVSALDPCVAHEITINGAA